jgi:hypothetical protein
MKSKLGESEDCSQDAGGGCQPCLICDSPADLAKMNLCQLFRLPPGVETVVLR